MHTSPVPSNFTRLHLRIALPLLIAPAFLLISAELTAHPGPLDQNGGHYDPSGTSYHCHMTNCAEPDTFTRGNRDSFMLDPSTRDRFYNEADWPLFEGSSGNCRSIRQTMLVITSRAPVSFTNPRECEARTGEWLDEYTGEVFNVAAQLELDHIIPRRYAHSHGGDRWPPQKKYEFANDPLNLVLVERREARRKSERGPTNYLPREEYQCEYAQQWLAIADKYDLRLNNRDSNRLNLILRECGDDKPTTSIDETPEL